MEMGLDSDGEKVPLVTLPIFSPSGDRMSAPSLAGGPVVVSPTRFLLTPFLIWLIIVSAPRKPPSARRRFPTVQTSAASTGVVSSSASWPYRHRPASRRNESLAPSAAGWTASLLKSVLASLTACSLGTEISNPSSPVYPHLVTVQSGMPSTVRTCDVMKGILVRSVPGGTYRCRVDIDSGPWSASSDLSSSKVISTSIPLALAFARCSLMCATSFSVQAALTTRCR
mmetsp:Transcript_38782/g.97036  ORF Transcript_38782/g.97036 Transcript_38782/m.97036 type:complete len:227 (-) Transcript_38782:444-1124(-)